MRWLRRKPEKPTRASQRRRILLIESAEGTRMKGLRVIPADRRAEAVRRMLEAAQ